MMPDEFLLVVLSRTFIQLTCVAVRDSPGTDRHLLSQRQPLVSIPCPRVLSPMRVFQVIVVLVVLAGVSPIMGQDEISAADETAKAVHSVLTHEHLGGPEVDEKFCARWLQLYLETLDPFKRYFLAADILEFEACAAKLPELATNGGTKLFNLVSRRYRVRAESALAHVDDRIDRTFDFTIDESIPRQYEKWPQTNQDRIERWRLQLKYDLLVERSRSEGRGAQIEFVKARYRSIRKQAAEQTEHQALGLYLDSFCRAVDPHSGYLTEEDFQSFMGGMLRESTIGVQTSTVRGRPIISGLAPAFRREPGASKIMGCELLAIRSQNGDIYHCREILPSAISRLVRFGLKQDRVVTLELYDETRNHRFAVDWPRR